MRKDQDSAVEALVEQLIEGGSENMATVFAGLFNLAMRIERERFLGAGHYERTPERRGYANGTRPKKIDTPAGTVRLEVPKTAGHEAPFYPQALERGRRSCRAVMLAVAEMYIKAQFVNYMRHLVTAAARQARSLAPGARPTRWNQLR